MWVTITVGASMFLFIIAIFGGTSRKMGRQLSEEWLFSNIFEKIYDAFCSKAEPQNIAVKLGLAYEKYIRNCRILRIETNWKKEAGMRIAGICIFIFSLLVSVLVKNVIVAVLGIFILFCLGPYQEQRIASRAKARKKQLSDDLPRFIDLFATAIEIGIPVETAIKTTAQDIPCVVSDELLLVMAETELGSKSWQRALEGIALKYDIGTFSDFVLALVAGYEKGIPISEIVARKSMEIKQTNLLEAKERAAKLSNAILLPVMVFKILPLLAIMLIPIMVQITSM